MLMANLRKEEHQPWHEEINLSKQRNKWNLPKLLILSYCLSFLHRSFLVVSWHLWGIDQLITWQPRSVWPAWGSEVHWGGWEIETHTYPMSAYCIPGTLPCLILIQILMIKDILAAPFSKKKKKLAEGLKDTWLVVPNIKRETQVWPLHICYPLPNRFPTILPFPLPARGPVVIHPDHKGHHKSSQ